ncbi:MAG: restriction endonuclease subunit S [Prevotella sp.]|nr:restriction endonuclease subunit S [Prevotella sp.]
MGDYGKVVTGNTPPTKDIENYENGTYLWASPADLGTIKSITETKTMLSAQGFSKTRTLPKGSVLVTCIGSTIGKAGMATKEMSTNQQINSIVVNENNDNEFVYYAIQSAFPRYLSSIAVQAVPIISKSAFEMLPNKRPCLQEQKKIGKFLSLLDERIATQNKIIEDLKKLKCAIIEKHFRQAKLHKYKICDLGVPFSIGSLSKEDLSEEGHECILYGELFTTYDCVINEVKSHTNKIANTTLSQKGDLLFPSSTTVDAVSLISPSVIDIPNVILGGDMFGIHIDKKFNAYYLSYYINLIARKKLAIYAKGSTIIHLHYKDIAKAQLLLPDLCEQDKIAKCMMAEDAKIKVEEQLLTKLEKQKQYLLRQMFI